MTKENLIKDLKNNLKFKKKHSQFDKFPKIFLDKFLVPKVAYLAHFMSSPPATPTM